MKTHNLSYQDIKLIREDLSELISRCKTVLVKKRITEDFYDLLLLDSDSEYSNREIVKTGRYNLTVISYDYLYKRLLTQYPSSFAPFEEYFILKDDDTRLDIVYMCLSSILKKRNTLVKSGTIRHQKKEEIRNFTQVVIKDRNNIHNRLLLINSLIESLLHREYYDNDFNVYSDQIYSLVKSIVNQEEFQLPKEFQLDNNDTKELTSTETEYTIFFEFTDSYNSFIEQILIPICIPIKKTLSEASLLLYKNWNYNNKEGVVVQFSAPKHLTENSIKPNLERFLLRSVPEYNLQYVEILKSEKISSDTAVFSEVHKLLTEDLIYQNSWENLDESRSITLCIYFYISVLRTFYKNKEEIIENNKHILMELIHESFSNYSSGMQFISDYLRLKDKILKEYNVLFYNSLDLITKNYEDLLDTDSFSLMDFKYLNLLTENETKEHIDKNIIPFINRSMDMFFIPRYYKAFIPFLVAKYYDAEAI